MQTETGNIRNKSFDVFPAISIPDLFMEKMIAGEDWYLFEPHEVEQVAGIKLQDYFNDDFVREYEKLVILAEKGELKIIRKLPAKKLFITFLKIIVEAGKPYVFFRDTANRFNPNKHC